MAENNNSPFNRKLIESIDKLTKALGSRSTPTPGGADQIENATQLEAIEANIAKIRTKQGEEIDKIEKLQKKGLADQAELEEAKLNHNKELLSVLYKQASLQEEITDDVAEEIKKREKIIQAKNAGLKIDQKAASLVESYAERLTGIRDMSEEVGVLNARGIQQMGQSLAKLISIQNLAANASRTMMEETDLAVRNFINARADFTRMTSLDDRNFSDQIIEITEASKTLGTTYADIGPIFAALQSQVIGFTMMSRESQNAMINQALELENLGISGGTTAEIHGTLINVFGMTSDAAIEVTNNAATLARTYGLTAETIVSSTASISRALARFGDETIEVTQQVQEFMGQTLLAEDQLVSLFNSASNLGAMTGLQQSLAAANIELDPNEMLMLTETGQVTEVLNTFQRIMREADLRAAPSLFQGISEEMGLSAAQARQLTQDTSSLNAEQLANRNGLISLRELAGRATNPVRKLTAVFNSFAIAVEPISDFLIDMLDSVAKFAEFSSGAFKAAGIIGTLLGGALGIAGTIASVGLLAKALGGIGIAITPLAVPMVGFGLAVGLAAAGIGVLAWGIGSMIEDLGSLEENKITSLESLLGTVTSSLPLFTLGLPGLFGFSAFLASIATYSRFADTEALNATADSFRNIHEAVQAVAEQPAAVATVKELLDKAEDVADAQAQVEYSILGEIASMTGIVSAVQNMQQSMNTLSDRPVEINVDGRRLAQINANYTDREARRTNIRRNG